MPAPPEGHPRQCKARSNKTQKRCRRWALQYSNFCQFHGGRRALSYQLHKGIYKLPSYYSKYLGPKLSERVHDALNKPHDEQVALFEELAISRSFAIEALKLAQPLFDEEMSKKLTVETKAAIMQNLRDSLDAVKNMVLAASKIEKESKETVSLKVINLIVQQIILAINDVCGTENMEIAEAIAQAIDDKVRVPINNKLEAPIEVNLLPEAS